MDAKQHLYYALGTLAYAVAKADGKVQPAEYQQLLSIVNSEIPHEVDFTYADIIFQILQKDKAGFKEVYDWAMHAFEKGKYHFTPELKDKFIGIIQQVAAAFPPVHPEEKKLLARFDEDIRKLEVRTAHN